VHARTLTIRPIAAAVRLTGQKEGAGEQGGGR
jgi:hypothetical protein